MYTTELQRSSSHTGHQGDGGRVYTPIVRPTEAPLPRTPVQLYALPTITTGLDLGRRLQAREAAAPAVRAPVATVQAQVAGLPGDHPNRREQRNTSEHTVTHADTQLLQAKQEPESHVEAFAGPETTPVCDDPKAHAVSPQFVPVYVQHQGTTQCALWDLRAGLHGDCFVLTDHSFQPLPDVPHLVPGPDLMKYAGCEDTYGWVREVKLAVSYGQQAVDTSIFKVVADELERHDANATISSQHGDARGHQHQWYDGAPHTQEEQPHENALQYQQQAMQVESDATWQLQQEEEALRPLQQAGQLQLQQQADQPIRVFAVRDIKMRAVWTNARELLSVAAPGVPHTPVFLAVQPERFANDPDWPLEQPLRVLSGKQLEEEAGFVNAKKWKQSIQLAEPLLVGLQQLEPTTRLQQVFTTAHQQLLAAGDSAADLTVKVLGQPWTDNLQLTTVDGSDHVGGAFSVGWSEQLKAAQALKSVAPRPSPPPVVDKQRNQQHQEQHDLLRQGVNQLLMAAAAPSTIPPRRNPRKRQHKAFEAADMYDGEYMDDGDQEFHASNSEVNSDDSDVDTDIQRRSAAKRVARLPRPAGLSDPGSKGFVPAAVVLQLPEAQPGAPKAQALKEMTEAQAQVYGVETLRVKLEEEGLPWCVDWWQVRCYRNTVSGSWQFEYTLNGTKFHGSRRGAIQAAYAKMGIVAAQQDMTAAGIAVHGTTQAAAAASDWRVPTQNEQGMTMLIQPATGPQAVLDLTSKGSSASSLLPAQGAGQTTQHTLKLAHYLPAAGDSSKQKPRSPFAHMASSSKPADQAANPAIITISASQNVPLAQQQAGQPVQLQGQPGGVLLQQVGPAGMPAAAAGQRYVQVLQLHHLPQLLPGSPGSMSTADGLSGQQRLYPMLQTAAAPSTPSQPQQSAQRAPGSLPLTTMQQQLSQMMSPTASLPQPQLLASPAHAMQQQQQHMQLAVVAPAQSSVTAAEGSIGPVMTRAAGAAPGPAAPAADGSPNTGKAPSTPTTPAPRHLTALPELRLMGDRMPLESVTMVVPALVTLLKELGCTGAVRTLMQRVSNYYSTNDEGRKAFVVHYMSLWAAVDLQDQAYIKDVLRDDWGLPV